MSAQHSSRTGSRRVRQILLNLLSNASKFGAEKPVEVSCRRIRDEGVMVEVMDQRQGIAEPDMPKIFEELVQLGGREQLENALGLPISRHVAALLGSELRVESKAGQGSTFRLLLPRRLPEGRAAS